MARGSVHVYSFKNVICAIGSHMPSGFAADNCITITEQGDGITDEAGADGELQIRLQDKRSATQVLQPAKAVHRRLFLPADDS